MKIKQITDFLLKQYPLNLQEKWDKSGFINKACLSKSIDNCIVCLDINQTVVNLAKKKKTKLIISHHPLFLEKEKKLSFHYNKKLIEIIKKNKITVLALHTNFDNNKQGMNFLLANFLNLKNISWQRKNNKTKFVIGSFNKPLTIKQISSIFKKKFNLQNHFTTNIINKTKKFTKIAICAGAGLSLLTDNYQKLKKENILLITGDIKYHNWQDLNNNQMIALDVTHYLENYFTTFIEQILKKHFPKLFCQKVLTKNQEITI